MSSDTMLSVSPQLIKALMPAEPKGAYGTADEDFLVFTCACPCDQHTTRPVRGGSDAGMEWQENAFPAVWEACLIVDCDTLCIVDAQTEAHVNCTEAVVACVFLISGARGGSSWLQNFPLPTQCPNPNPRVPNPKPHQMHLQTGPMEYRPSS